MSVTVGELKELLKGYEDTHLVVMSKDGEGNGFSPLSQVENCFYEAETTWSGEVHGLDQEDSSVDEVSAIVLWPVN